MKKITLLFYLMTCVSFLGYSQMTTSYGVLAGTGGTSNSFFGYETGRDAVSPSLGNTAMGYSTMRLSTHGIFNTAIGSVTLIRGGDRCTAVGAYALYDNRDLNAADPGGYNTAVGYRALMNNSVGDNNTANGGHSLFSNTSGSNNTSSGYQSLYLNTTGNYNTASGASALYNNTSGQKNTAQGHEALFANIIGTNNTANGYYALYSNTGSHNTAVGSYCMNLNTSGTYNTAIGHYALADNNNGMRNSAEGFRALDNNTSGSYNTAQGAHALNNLATGSYNSALGYNAGPTLTDLTNTTALGYLATPTASNQVRIGNASVTSIGGFAGWTDFSDGRFKKDVKEDVSGLDFISQLRPVSYTVDNARLNEFLHVRDSSSNPLEAKSTPVRKTGFIAQEVEALIIKTGYVFSGVDAPENENDPYGIRYSEFVVPLVKGMQELTAMVESQQQQIEEQRKQIETLLAQAGSKSTGAFNANTTAALLQNNPNPFDAETEIKMTLPDDVGYATIMIYNLEGKQLKTIQVPERGDVKVNISANELSPGMYLYSLITDGRVVDTKRMVLTK